MSNTISLKLRKTFRLGSFREDAGAFDMLTHSMNLYIRIFALCQY